MIDRVANAQKRADDARAKALQDYIRLLNSAPSGVSGVGGGVSGVGGGTQTGADILSQAKEKPTSALTPMEVSGLRYAAQAEAQYNESLSKISLTNKVAQQSLNQGLSSGLGLSAALSGARYAAQAAAQYNITVNAGVGDPEAIARTLEDVLNQSSHRGTSTNRGTGVYIK
jgi:hypothetical protein